MWETWREEMRRWGRQQWLEWHAEHERRKEAANAQAQQEAAEHWQRIDQERRRLGIREGDIEQLQELLRQDRLQHPEESQSSQESDRRRAMRRQEVLTYPTLSLRHHAHLQRPEGVPEQQDPLTVGFGAADDAVALWDGSSQGAALVSWYHCDGRLAASTPLTTVSWPHRVQPLPDGQVLIIGSHTADGFSAAVYDASGRLVRAADVGKSVTHVLSTADGQVWIGYDNAVANEGEFRLHGLVRFDVELSPQWRYPLGTALPAFPTCQALNVNRHKAWMYDYASFHLVNIDGQQAVDHGRVPVDGAHGMLVEGDHAAAVGGYAGERDAITPLRLTADGIWLAGPPVRLVLPGGADLPQGLTQARYTCRGSELHLSIGAEWYRLDLDDLPTG
ncbi:YD repeat-containing protein [Kineococcus xinjiangensis]|uniref:YD repeat-containing protein n=1 Tax=Kineococcus xinjiangensis TaxID=512762 RepID=A0A2S6IBX3_9ACTN|nr:hypothetical protein [Kineococcus xinjiangensis]PPK89820.1 YD repeat-containing protein [Kineococcus xinjiangensis]